MEAVKFIEEAKRMCNANMSDCAECCKGGACPINIPGANYTPEERVKLVEEWAASHPRKTRQDVFLKQWPDTQLDKEGNIIICPRQMCVGEEFIELIAACRGTNCDQCRRKFWGKVM